MEFWFFHFHPNLPSQTFKALFRYFRCPYWENGQRKHFLIRTSYSFFKEFFFLKIRASNCSYEILKFRSKLIPCTVSRCMNITLWRQMAILFSANLTKKKGNHQESWMKAEPIKSQLQTNVEKIQWKRSIPQNITYGSIKVTLENWTFSRTI